MPREKFPVGEVVAGQVIQAGVGMNIARQVSLKLGLPQEITAHTVNMVCGSGLKAVGLAAQNIACGEVQAALALGVESMSGAPYLAANYRWGARYGDGTLRDAISADALSDPATGKPMGDWAENIAQRFKISRADQGMRGRLPVIKKRRNPKRNSPAKSFPLKPNSAAWRAMSTCAPIPAWKNWRLWNRHFGNREPSLPATPQASTTAPRRYCWATKRLLGVLPPRARIMGIAAVGCDPQLTGMGPVGAIKKLCAQLQWDWREVSAVEINEAFASQTLACIRELNLEESHVNQRGGGIALGHPVGCSGARHPRHAVALNGRRKLCARFGDALRRWRNGNRDGVGNQRLNTPRQTVKK